MECVPCADLLSTLNCGDDSFETTVLLKSAIDAPIAPDKLRSIPIEE